MRQCYCPNLYLTFSPNILCSHASRNFVAIGYMSRQRKLSPCWSDRRSRMWSL
jgi:hypothetical protein